MEACSGCSKPSRRPLTPLATPAKLVAQGLGDTGVDTEVPTPGKLSKCSWTGEEMAERVSIKEEMTSGAAGLTETWLEERRDSFRGLVGKERRFRSLGSAAAVGVDREVRAEVLKGIAGP